MSWPSQVALVVKNPYSNTGGSRDLSWVCGPGTSPGVENDNPLQCSCLENSMVRGAWRATVHWAPKNRTLLSDWAHTHGEVLKRICIVYLTTVSVHIYVACLTFGQLLLCLHSFFGLAIHTEKRTPT